MNRGYSDGEQPKVFFKCDPAGISDVAIGLRYNGRHYTSATSAASAERIQLVGIYD